MTSKTTMLHELERVLRERRAAGETIALVIDEAQSLSHELLEEIRLLANIETSTEKLLPVVLAGQPELADRLNEPSLRQLKQRVALRCDLGLLSPTETAGYIAGRLRVAGGDAGQIFTREAVEIVAERSGGIPRTINVICDNALVGGLRGRRQAGRRADRPRRLRGVRPGIRAADQRRARGSRAGRVGRREGGTRRRRTRGGGGADVRRRQPPAPVFLLLIGTVSYEPYW